MSRNENCRQNLKRLFPTGKSILEYLYPPACAFCDVSLTGRKGLCDSCKDTLGRINSPFCDVCGEPFPGEINGPFKCPNCTGLTFHFEFARAALSRSDRALELVHRLKYGRQIDIAEELGTLACEAFLDQRLSVAKKHSWPLIPVPLHPSRKQKRYFNQAEEIAKVIAHRANLPILNALRRIRKTTTQTTLSRSQRMKNLKGAFVLTSPLLKTGTGERLPQEVILVDDVFTTGSTVDACAKVLSKAGVERIAVLTVVRG